MDIRKINTEENRETITSDEALLEDFFNNCQQEIDDNGFTEKVMKGLPVSASWLNKIWTIVCVMTGIAFLYFTHALQGLADSLTTIGTQLHSFHPTPTMLLSVILTLSALTVIGSYSFFQREDF